MATIFFDLDGTLTNPKSGITRSIQYALDKLSLAVPSEDELTWCIGPPLHASLQKLTGSSDLADRALLLYRERFSDIGLFENEAYTGIVDTLATLAATNQRMFVATSKPAVYATRIVDHFGLKSYFERVFGSELDGTRVDKRDLLRYALGETRANADSAIMIGDRSHDVVGARTNGMTAIGVLYGYGSEAELKDAGAHHICAAHPELLGHCVI
ncbi:HAD family hydrolase [Bradyrhizobium guangdongense]|uniref:Hydrolase n=1 Tax=Bradyrhizobium guangdongense TaxID=1325090 RepID=A0A410V8S3_9BRAD|nr:HAD family hydrolase [Bradyrhizobium guangdongense]QAU40044.1 HAD family hydrolase [Bradyrhizobium guangdongense]QOZ61109.1 HAD family hydrolase [Bradyrhizobium guangdongense]GGI28712.1 hydrolase [Bradyrhizobium guangdongense]